MKILIRQNQQYRKYHVYKMASNVLKILHYDLVKREKHIRPHATNIQGNQNINIKNLLKNAKQSNHLKEIQLVEQKLEACENLGRLCEEAYELGKKVREGNGFSENISEELYEFIVLTNEHHVCYQKEDYEKIKWIYKTK